jgi:short-subunit dehydrogenase
MYQRIAEKVNRLDLAIVINNAGVLYNGYYKEIPAENNREVAIINTYPYVLLTKALLPKLKSR